jgi:hypothetical protein
LIWKRNFIGLVWSGLVWSGLWSLDRNLSREEFDLAELWRGYFIFIFNFFAFLFRVGQGQTGRQGQGKDGCDAMRCYGQVIHYIWLIDTIPLSA